MMNISHNFFIMTKKLEIYGGHISQIFHNATFQKYMKTISYDFLIMILNPKIYEDHIS